MAEHGQQEQCGAAGGSDDEFETVVRKRHSNSHANNYYNNSQKFRGGMDYSNTYNGGGGGGGGGAGRGRDRECGGRDFRSSSSSNNTNNSRNFRRKPYRERDFHSENRRYPHGEHRDNKLQQQNNIVLPTSHNSNNNNQQTQFPQTNNHSSTSISIIHTTTSTTHNNTNTVGHINGGGGEPSSCTNYVTLNSRLTVTNGSVCSESGSSSAESVHSNTGGVDVVDAQINHNCHVSGGSICGSASTCDTDLAQIIQIEEEELRSPLVVVAPPPAVNPWRVNPNAASVITKKSPAFHKLASAEAVNDANPTQISSQMNNQTQENYNAPRSNSVGGMNSGGGGLKNTSKKDMIKKRNNVPLPNNTNKPRNSSSSKPDLKLDMSRDMNNVLKDASPMNSPMSPKAAELPSENGADSPKDADKGECCDPDIIAQPVVEELIIAPAPLPRVNPWQANKNAVSVITGRIESALPKITQQPLSTTTPSPLLTPTVENRARNTEMSTGNSTANTKTTPLLQPTTSTLSDTAKTQKTTSFASSKPTTNASQTANCTSLTVAETNVLGVSASTPRYDTTSTGEDMTDGLAQSQHKDIQPQQGPKFRRGFAAVTKHRHKGISTNSALSSIRNSPEDWPSLQTTVTVTVPQPQAKPVISLPVSPVKKMAGGANQGGGEESTATTSIPESDDILGLQKPETLPTSANNWPSMVNTIVSGDNNKENSLESGWHSGSELNNEDTPSEASSGEILTNNKDLLPDEVNSGNQSENGSLGSGSSDQSVDNELETDGSGTSKKGKKSKQKWTKLDLPQTPSAKTRSRQERQQSMEKERLEKGTINKESVDSLHQNEAKPKSKGSFNNNNNNNNNSKDNIINAKLANGPSNDSRQNYPSRGRGRASGVRGRSGRSGGGRGQYWSYRESPTTDIIITTQQLQDYLSVEDYQDYPADYTTLPPLYPVTEFAMPYVGEPFFHPTSALATTQEQTGYSSPPNNTTEDGSPSNYESTILDSVQKQIEYYFSEENLGKDFYLRRRMDPEGYLPINFIATFPRLKTLTQDLASVIQAIQASQDLELTENFTYVRTRISPEKWPILNDDAPPAPNSNATSQPLLPTPTSSVSPFVTYQYPPTSNGSCDMLSSDSSSSNHSSFSPSGINLNPDVPEFVPKSNINVSLTA